MSVPMWDGRADRKAGEMCKEIIVGAPITSAEALAKNSDVELWLWPEDKDVGIHYKAWFPGLLANGYSCNGYAINGVVHSRFTDEHKWQRQRSIQI
jgi:hypothetical protein